MTAAPLGRPVFSKVSQSELFRPRELSINESLAVIYRSAHASCKIPERDERGRLAEAVAELGAQVDALMEAVANAEAMSEKRRREVEDGDQEECGPTGPNRHADRGRCQIRPRGEKQRCAPAASSVYRTKRHFVLGNLQAALREERAWGET